MFEAMHRHLSTKSLTFFRNAIHEIYKPPDSNATHLIFILIIVNELFEISNWGVYFC